MQLMIVSTKLVDTTYSTEQIYDKVLANYRTTMNLPISTC